MSPMLGRRLAPAALLVLVACGEGGGATLTRGAGPSSTGGAPVVTTSTTLGPPAAADTPAGLAAQLAEVEAAIRNPATPPAALARLGHAQQLAYGALGRRPEWHTEVVAGVPPALRPAVERNLRAVTELRRQAEADAAYYGSSGDRLPDWRIVAPEPAARLLQEYRAAEAALGVPWQYLAAIHLVETRMGRIRGNSVAGAQGPMQFIPTTWAIYGAGGDINNTRDAIMAAARLLKANGAPSDMGSALYSYNPSQRYVRAVAAYAENMAADERAYLGYHQWQVYYSSKHLPEGFGGG